MPSKFPKKEKESGAFLWGLWKVGNSHWLCMTFAPFSYIPCFYLPTRLPQTPLLANIDQNKSTGSQSWICSSLMQLHILREAEGGWVLASCNASYPCSAQCKETPWNYAQSCDNECLAQDGTLKKTIICLFHVAQWPGYCQLEADFPHPMTRALIV